MNPTRSFTLSCLALVVLIGLGGQAFASTVAVGTNPACQPSLVHFATIQLAVNSVPAGSTIKVCPGNYPEQVSIISKNLTLIGVPFGTSDAAVVVVPAGGLVTNGVTDIFGAPTAAQIFVQNTAVTISHLTVDGANDGLTDCSIDAIGIYYQNSSGTITSNAVRNVLLPTGLQGCQDGLAINVESNIGAPSVTISSNSVRNYDKNGITASGPDNGNPGPNVTVTGNTIIGLGATTVTAQNGIQIGYGATGTVTSNNVVDDIYINPPSCSPCYGASGILIYGSAGVTVTSNTVESTQFGIVPVTEAAGKTANGTVVKLNHVGGTQNYDAIDLCSDGNTAQSNVIYGSSQDGIHTDDTCPPSTGSSNTVTGNTINEACAGILLGSGTGNTTTPNSFLNVTNTTLAGDTCTPLVGPSKKHQSLRPSPYKMTR
jgi:Periplasmic copper-binding protein (NosD)